MGASSSKASIEVRIAEAASAAELAGFFATNLSPNYISHSELQGYRASKPDRWAVNIDDVILTELTRRLATRRKNPTRFVIEGRRRGRVVAIALLTLTRRSLVPYAILEDLVVDKKARGRGYGKQMVDWISALVRGKGIHRLFLESGKDNRDAHSFFEKIGFKPISVVMMWDMPP